MNPRESAAHGFVEGECERVSKCVARGEEKLSTFKSSKLSIIYNYIQIHHARKSFPRFVPPCLCARTPRASPVFGFDSCGPTTWAPESSRSCCGVNFFFLFGFAVGLLPLASESAASPLRIWFEIAAIGFALYCGCDKTACIRVVSLDTSAERRFAVGVFVLFPGPPPPTISASESESVFISVMDIFPLPFFAFFFIFVSVATRISARESKPNERTRFVSQSIIPRSSTPAPRPLVPTNSNPNEPNATHLYALSKNAARFFTLRR